MKPREINSTRNRLELLTTFLLTATQDHSWCVSQSVTHALPSIEGKGIKRVPTINLTARAVDSLKPETNGKRIEYWDEGFPGFGVRVSTDGRKSWVLMYRFEGRLRRMTLGTYPSLSLGDARKFAREASLKPVKGIDPAGVKCAERNAPNFDELAAEYLDRHAKAKKRSWKEDERLINRELLPAWRYVKAKSITRRMVIQLLDEVMDRNAPIQANRLLALSRKIFNFAIQRDLLETNPCWQVAAPGVEKERERVLSPDELRTLWGTLCGPRAIEYSYFKLLLLTAQRPGEVAGMRWCDIDLAAAWWVLSGDQTKNGLPHRVPLSKAAVSCLREAKLRAGDSDWVFPGRQWLDRGKRKNRVNLKRTLNRLRIDTAIEFRAHDLRRTAASYMASMGIPRLTISKLLNHVEKSVTKVYDRHSYDSEKKLALENWGQFLCEKPYPSLRGDIQMLSLSESGKFPI